MLFLLRSSRVELEYLLSGDNGYSFKFGSVLCECKCLFSSVFYYSCVNGASHFKN